VFGRPIWEHQSVGNYLVIDDDLDLAPDGRPRRPLIVLDLNHYRDRPEAECATLAGRVRTQLALTVGTLRGAPSPALTPLLDALTLTVAQDVPDPAALPRPVLAVADAAGAVATVRDAVAHTPRAALACGHLLRQTAMLDATSGLAAEAAVYSMLLGGREFARWLEERGPARAYRAPDRPLVRLRRDGARLDIELDHPERRNALSVRLREELLAAVQVAELDSTITAVALHGAGPVFCSGGDLDEFGVATDVLAAYLVRLDRAPWRVLDRIADRVTVRVRGACIGAGAEIAAFAGAVVAAPDTVFRFPEVGMGLVPGAGGTVSAPRRIGRWRAAWLMLTGTPLSARGALDWGLVDRLTDAEPG
jgi:enoyl-CoA hydratase/carnithine racemase